MARPALRRPVVEYVHDHYPVTRRRACRLVRLHRSVFYYRSVKDPKLALRGRMREIARTRVRYGYRRIHVLLRREGWTLGRNQAYRLYTEEALQLRSKLPRRRKMLVTRRERFVPRRPNEAWCMDFVADQLTNGQRFRALTIVDVFSREALAIQVGQSLRGEHVVGVCNQLVAQVVRRSASSSTTAANFPGAYSTFGLTITACSSTSAGPGSPPTIVSSRRSTGRCATSV
jgi:putative transposase